MRRLLLYSTIFFGLGIFGCVASPEDGASGVPEETDAGSDVGQDADAEPDSGPLVCDPECSGETPRCVEGACVECDVESDEGCGGATPFCESTDEGDRCVECNSPGSDEGCSDLFCSDDFECVTCLDNDVCQDRTRSKCENAGTSDAECVACEGPDDCMHIDGMNQCRDETCVQCTPATEDEDCGGNVCDRTTLECTNVGIGSAGGCASCVSDSNCKAGFYCIPMEYMGNDHGNYCMPVSNNSTCSNVFSEPEDDRETIDGAEVDVCLIRERLMTCEALSVFDESCDSGSADECTVNGARAPGARCESGRCTYGCVSPRNCKMGAVCTGNPADGEYCD